MFEVKMPPEELTNTRRRFIPLPGEDIEAVEQKVAAYKHFINNATNLIDPINRGGKWDSNKAAAINAAIDASFDAVTNEPPLPDDLSFKKPGGQ